jgi:hypothetical protein
MQAIPWLAQCYLLRKDCDPCLYRLNMTLEKQDLHDWISLHLACMLNEFCSKTAFGLPLNYYMNQIIGLNSVQWHDLMVMAEEP